MRYIYLFLHQTKVVPHVYFQQAVKRNFEAAFLYYTGATGCIDRPFLHGKLVCEEGQAPLPDGSGKLT